MNPHQWRLIDDGALPGALNMARDMAILDGLSGGASPPTLRLYTWSPPCLTLGRHQPEAAAGLTFCREHGIDVARRPTGGRAVLHHLELTYAVIATLGEDLPTALQETYRTICAGLVRACRDLNVPAELTAGDVHLSLPGPRSTVPCFKAPAGGEVVVDGRKLIGSAMRRRGQTVLQHGAILLDWDGALQAASLRLADDRTLRPFVTTISDELGGVPPARRLREAIVAGIEQELGVVIRPGGLAPSELETAEQLVPRFAVLTSRAGGTAAPQPGQAGYP